MGKVYSFLQLKAAKTNKNCYLEAAGIEKYEEMLEGIYAILDLLYTETESFLRDNDFPIDQFVLDENSAKAFLSADYMEVFDGGEEELSISYIANIGDIEYRTLATAQIDGENVETEVNIYKRDDNEWVAFDGDDIWVEGPGEDFF